MKHLTKVCLLTIGMFLILGCEKTQTYETQVKEQMQNVLAQAAVDSIVVEDSLLCINFVEPQTKEDYLIHARENAIKFSKFRQQKVGASEVTVYCTYKGLIYAEANAKQGEIISAK